MFLPLLHQTLSFPVVLECRGGKNSAADAVFARYLRAQF